MNRKIVRVGNSLGITISPDLLASCGLAEGSKVEVLEQDGRIVVSPATSLVEQMRTWSRRPVDLGAGREQIVEMIRADRESH